MIKVAKIETMSETQINYSVFDCGNELKETPSTSNKTLNTDTSSDTEKDHVTFKKRTLYVIAILTAIVLILNGLFMFLIASRKQDCNSNLPEETSMEEKQRGNNPTTGKSITGCPVGWLKNDQSCYYYSNDSSAWLDAMMQCIKLDSYLVEINTAREDTFLRAQAQQSGVTDCYNQTSALYNGSKTTTFEGRHCQRWDTQYPHSHSRNNISHFPETLLTDVQNYCRDPDGEGMPWCYTTDPDVRWQFCGVYKCPGDFWIGMSDQAKEAPWLWVTSRLPITYSSYTNWGPGEPSNKAKKYEHCGALNATSGLAWSDRNCFWPAFYICERNTA